MADGGPEFDNKTVREACLARGTELRIVPAYSPWINGPIKGMNGKLLGRLKHLCTPDLGEDEYERMSKDDIPGSWPDHFNDALEYLNTRILPHFKFTPNKLLLGLVINTTRTPDNITTNELTVPEVVVQMAYMDQLRLDGHAAIVEHANKRKNVFDKKLTSWAPKEIIFTAGQLVQVYRNDLDFTFQVGRKMEPKWSAPRQVTKRDRNSYKLESLEGLPIGGHFSSRRLRRFIPRTGTQLHEAQQLIEKVRGEEEVKADRVNRKEGTTENGADALFENEELSEDIEELISEGVKEGIHGQGAQSNEDVA
ncbi:hypothetical protein DXG01_006433 [Tephrocybe rancida]|nr:hypothetical protein DXG01_006433 [Tephrocybe rancida]